MSCCLGNQSVLFPDLSLANSTVVPPTHLLLIKIHLTYLGHCRPHGTAKLILDVGELVSLEELEGRLGPGDGGSHALFVGGVEVL